MSDGTVTGRAKADLRDGLSAHKGDLIVSRVNSHEAPHRPRPRPREERRPVERRQGAPRRIPRRDAPRPRRPRRPAGRVRRQQRWLGYAATVHRAQGLTADTSHVLADSSTTRAMAYVAMTRGKESNRLYVEADDAQTMGDVLEQIANNSDGMLSAHETIRAEQTRVGDLVVLVDQYQDVAERADATRFERIARQAVGRRVAREASSLMRRGAHSSPRCVAPSAPATTPPTPCTRRGRRTRSTTPATSRPCSRPASTLTCAPTRTPSPGATRGSRADLDRRSRIRGLPAHRSRLAGAPCRAVRLPRRPPRGARRSPRRGPTRVGAGSRRRTRGRAARGMDPPRGRG
ncbi:hypothetical protein [Clavibacter tessellarius]|uniref:C-terminal helicase domain-containing protein n=1 Tax=Clavibacter tessellarius TaxID=31965 RepID=UPI00324796E7